MALPGTPTNLDLLGAATAPDFLTAALRYQALGLTVLPVLKGEKKSGLTGWQNLSLTPAELRRLFATGKYGGVALRPGAISRNLVMVDCDGEAVYSAFYALFPALVDTYTERSGSGKGYHLFYQVDTLPTTGTKIMRKGIFDTDDLGFELFFDSGAVIVAPSIHPSGNPYTVEKPLDVLRVADLADVVTWAQTLEDKTSRTRKAREANRPPRHTPADRSGNGDLPADLLRDIAQALGVERYKRDGWSTPVRCILAKHEHDDTNPAAAWNGEKHIYSCLKCGVTDMLALDAARVLNLDVGRYYERPSVAQPGTPAHKPKKSIRRRLKPATHPRRGTVRVQRVSDDLKPADILATPTLLIQAPTGLGKSFTVADAINTLPDDQSITAIAQFRLLTSSLYELLKDFGHYEQTDTAHQRALGQLNRLVTSLSSLAKFDRHGGRVVIDEITGVLKFLAESGTFKHGEALAAFRALVRLLETATQLVGMDANLDGITIRFIEKYRGKVTVKRYERIEPRGQVVLLRDQAAAVCTLEKLLSRRRGQVYAACSSEKTASEVADYFSGRGYSVLKVTRDTSNTTQVKRASVDPNTRCSYDLIVYDSSWGAGVDISERVYAQVSIFDRLPLAPEDAIQLVGRVRHAERRYAAVIGDGEGYPTPSADELLADILKRERWTSTHLNATPQDTGDMLELAQLWAQFKARQLRETARWRYYFARRLQADSFSVIENNAYASEAFREAWKQWKADRSDQHWQTILTVDRPLPDEELDTLRLAGTEITGELRLRNVRWHIEGAKAVSEVTDQDRDLMKERGRHRLFHLRDWLGDIDDLRAVDLEQADESRPIHQRRYSTLTHAVIAELFRLMGHEGTPEHQLIGFIATFQQSISAPDVVAHYGVVTGPEAMSKFKALGHYGNNAVTVTGLCRWLLEYFGLKMNSQRRRVEGELTMFYQVDAETLDYRLGRARTAADRRERLIRNVYSSLKYTKVISQNHAPPSTAEDASGEALPGESGDGYTTYAGALALAQNMRALGIDRWKEARHV